MKVSEDKISKKILCCIPYKHDVIGSMCFVIVIYTASHAEQLECFFLQYVYVIKFHFRKIKDSLSLNLFCSPM